MNPIHHIALNCSDLKAQEAFYTRHFGFHRSRVLNEGTPEEFLMLRVGPTCMELFSAASDSASQRGGEQAVGFKHLAFEVTDIEAVIAGLHADGTPTDEILELSELIPGLRVCFFDDPEGNRLELIQGYRDQFSSAE